MTIPPCWYECDTCTRRIEVKAPELPDTIACVFCEGTMERMRQQSIEFRVDHLERVVRVLEAASKEYGQPEAPPNPVHSLASLEERLTRRISAVETRVGISDDPRGGAGNPPWMKHPSEHPPGVVSPHVRKNLDALAEWTNPERWQSATNAPPDEVARLRTVLDHIHGLVMIAMAGEDVPRPT